MKTDGVNQTTLIAGLTEQEHECLKAIGRAFDLFQALPVIHPWSVRVQNDPTLTTVPDSKTTRFRVDYDDLVEEALKRGIGPDQVAKRIVGVVIDGKICITLLDS